MAGNDLNIFSVAGRAMSAQQVRMNTAASNLANASAVASNEGDTYRPIKAVFATQMDQKTGLATVNVASVVRTNTPALRQHDPGNPMADENGDVWGAPVDENAEMVEMLDSSRQYQNLVETLSTAKQLMLDTIRMK